MSGSSNSSTKSKLSSSLRELFGVAKKLVGHERDIESLDQILDNKRELEKNLKLKEEEVVSLRSDKDKEIQSLRTAKEKEIETLRSTKDKEVTTLKSSKDILFKEFQEKYKTWDTGTTKQQDLEDEINELKVKLNQANERANSSEGRNIALQQQLREFQDGRTEMENKLKVVRGLLNSKERELTGAVKGLEDYQRILDEGRRELGLEYLDHKDLITKFSAFAEKCHDLVGRFFLTQLPEDLASDHLWMKLHQSGFNKAASRNIPISNSVPSKYLRTAVAEKVIANKLYTDIFQQYYLPESPAARGAMDDVLDRLYMETPRGEAIFRRRLLSAYHPQEEEHQVMNVMESTLAEVVGILDPLLFSPDVRERFQSELGQLLVEAVNLWRPIQRSAMKGVVENDPEADWSEYKEYDTAVGLTAEQASNVPAESDAIMSLFPRVFIGADVICPGYALWSSQNTIVAANIEYSQSTSRNSVHGRVGSSIRGGITRRGSDRRKLSLSGGGIGNLQTPPGSPLGNQSFSDHVRSRSLTIPGVPLGEDERLPGGNPGGE
ncbi:MAG: hypothetical protein M1813_007241 [Trichoglossum hirsutum]|nr:MAG: hypothetical protein M1813_007241 [Trichoglossum hirsutum]